MQATSRTVRAAVAAAAAITLAAPASASASGATVTGDDSNPVALGGPVTLRQMDFDVTPTFTPEEVSAKRHYSLVILDPAGQVSSTAVDCFPSNVSPIVARGTYRGNGPYTAVLTTYPDAERSADECKSGAVEQRLPFTVSAGTGVGPLPPAVLSTVPSSSVSQRGHARDRTATGFGLDRADRHLQGPRRFRDLRSHGAERDQHFVRPPRRVRRGRRAVRRHR